MTLKDTHGVTVLLNSWIEQNDLNSANQLKSIIYYHLKGLVKKQLINKIFQNSVRTTA